jgi:hypothetical protein
VLPLALACPFAYKMGLVAKRLVALVCCQAACLVLFLLSDVHNCDEQVLLFILQFPSAEISVLLVMDYLFVFFVQFIDFWLN